MIRVPRTALLAAFLAAAVPSALRGGAVTTRDGKTIQGRTHWGDGGTVVVEPAGGEARSFPLADVAAATFDRKSDPAPLPAPAPSSAPTTLPAAATNSPATEPATKSAASLDGWLDGDVGGASAEASMDGGRLVVRDSGQPLKAARKAEKRAALDSLHFIYQRADGDFEAVARVYVEEERPGRAGLMARESLDPDAPYAMISRGGPSWPDGPSKTALLARPERGAGAEVIATSEIPIIGATWLKLKRTGPRFEAFESANGKNWVPVGQADVPFTAKSPAYVGLASACGQGRESIFDHPQMTGNRSAPSDAGPAQALVFRDATLLAAEVVKADETQVTYRRPGEEHAEHAEHVAPAHDLARLLLRPVSGELAAKLGTTAGPGLLLTGGDFVDGDFKGIADGQASISNLLFGLKTFDVDRQVAAVVWAKPESSAARTLVLLADGSKLAAKSLATSEGVLKVQCPVAGEVNVRLEDVVELKDAAASAERRP